MSDIEVELPCDNELRNFDNFTDPGSLANRYFGWLEHYHPIEVFWKRCNSDNHEGENYPYEAFRDIAIKRLSVMIEELQAMIENEDS